jgi:Cytotoxic
VPVPIPSTTFIEGLDFIGQPGGRRRYRVGKRIYEWDSLHGELEVYDSRGHHLGAADAESGELIKPAVRGRRIDV